MCVCTWRRSGASSPWGSASESDEEPSFRVSPARRSLSNYAKEQLQSQSSSKGAAITYPEGEGGGGWGQPACCMWHLIAVVVVVHVTWIMDILINNT